MRSSRTVATTLAAAVAFSLAASCGPYAEGAAEGPSGGGQGGSRAVSAEDGSGVRVSVLATDLEAPWSFALLPGGDALVTERDAGRLLRVSPSGDVREVQTLPEEGSGEGGLLGVAVSPDYGSDGLVYAYYTTEEDNRVVRFRPSEEPEPFEAESPEKFQDLMMELRESEASSYSDLDTPIFTCRRKGLPEILGSLG